MAVLIVLCQSVQSLAVGGISIFLPLIRHDAGLSFSEAGTLASATQLTYAVMQIPAGYLADRFGAKRLFLAGIAGTAILAFSFGAMDSYAPMLFNQAASGIFRSFMFAPGLLLITSLFPAEKRSTAMGLYVAGGVSSNVFVSALGPILVGPLGWRALFFIFSSAGIVVLVLYWRFGPKGPAVLSQNRTSFRQLGTLFRSRVMLLVGGIQYVRLAVASGIRYWLPTFIVVQKGFSLETAGLVLALLSFISAPANFIGGYLADRIRNPYLVIFGAQTMLTAATFTYVYANSLPMLLAVAAVNGLVIQMYFGPTFTIALELLPGRPQGVVTGFGNFFANLGGLTFAFTIGLIKDVTGSFAWGFYSLSLMCFLGMIFTFLLWRMVRAMKGKEQEVAMMNMESQET